MFYRQNTNFLRNFIGLNFNQILQPADECTNEAQYFLSLTNLSIPLLNLKNTPNLSLALISMITKLAFQQTETH